MPLLNKNKNYKRIIRIIIIRAVTYLQRKQQQPKTK